MWIMKKRNKSDSSPSAAGLDDHGLAKAGYPLPEIFIFSSGFVKEGITLPAQERDA